MNIKFRDVSLALLAASVLTLAACAHTKDDATSPPADATAPADSTTTPPADATTTPPADTTTPPPADSAAPASTTTP